MVEDLPPDGPQRQNQRLRLTVVGFFFAGLFLLALGAGLFLFRGTTADKDIEIISAADSKSVGEIVVHVDGAVTRPGVYQLKTDSRVNDAISAAGGLSGNADQSKINLAAKITDGQKIYVFAQGENTGTTSIKGITSITGSDLININTASESELDKLPESRPKPSKSPAPPAAQNRLKSHKTEKQKAPKTN